MNKKYLGVFSILLASVMWAIEPIFAKLSYQNADALQTSAIRAIFAAMTAFIYIAITNKEILKIKKHQLTSLMYIAIVGTLFADLMYFFALKQVPVINAVIIGHMQPIFIIIIAFVFLNTDKLNTIHFLSFLMHIPAKVATHSGNKLPLSPLILS